MRWIALALAVSASGCCLFGSGEDQMEWSYQSRLESLDELAARSPAEREAILAAKAGFEARHAALPASGSERESALGRLNQDMRTHIEAVEGRVAASESAEGDRLRPLLRGSWRGEGFELDIAPGGNVHYERREGATSRTLDGTLDRVTGESFDVKVLLVSTTFRIDSPPREENGAWRMTVDGVALTRQP